MKPLLSEQIDKPLLEARLQDQLISELCDKGWSIIPDFIPSEDIEQLQQAAAELLRQDLFHQAGIGQGESHALHERIRSDHIMWLDPANTSGSLGRYLALLEAFRLLINRTLYLNLHDYEGHVAIYPPGSFYRKHLDQFQGDDRRTVTAILYLNDDWKEADGGQLRIYTDAAQHNYEEVLPHAGQFVTFLSSRFVHEVLPARRERLSITGWFRRRSGL